MLRIVVSFALILSLALHYNPAVAKEKTYTVVVQDYKALPPYSAYENGTYSGFNRELLDLFAETKGYKFKYVAYPVKRLFYVFVNGVGDLKYPDNAKWALHVKKEAKIHYSDAAVEYINGVMVLPAKVGGGTDRIKRLGLVAGWTPIGFQDRIKGGLTKLLENNSYSGLLKQAMLQRIDGAYSNVATSKYYLKNVLKKPGGLVFDRSLPHVRSARVLSSIKHPELIAEFNRFLKDKATAVRALKLKHAVEDGVLTN